MTFALIFLAYFVLNGLFIIYLKAVNNNQAIKAGSYAAMMYMFMAYGIINYVKEPIYLLAVGLGSFCGTSLVVWYKAPGSLWKSK